jgi:hypothetical protein
MINSVSLLDVQAAKKNTPGRLVGLSHAIEPGRAGRLFAVEIGNLVTLDRLTRPRVTVYPLPIAVRGLEALPPRVIAREEA